MLIDRNKPVALNRRLGLSRPGGGKRWLALAGAVLALGSLAAFSFGGGPGPAKPSFASKPKRPVKSLSVPFRADCTAEPSALQGELSQIAANFDGQAGIAVTKAGCDWMVGARLDDFFPQQSVSKFWVSLAVLDAVDAGAMRLDQQLTIRPQDLTLFNQPLRHEVLETGAAVRPVEQLMRDAMSLSDNTANDRLMWTLGGPKQVRAVLKEKDLEGIRFGPGERLLQSQVAGLRWSQDLSIGSNFEQARARLPRAEREAALNRYVADPIDGATPAGLASALARLAKGDLLSAESTEVLLKIMGRSRSGPMRLKAGVPPGWKVYHKTGTGQELGALATGYNDVALLEAADGSYYAVAVLIGATRQPIRMRMEMMQAVSRAVAQFHASRTIPKR